MPEYITIRTARNVEIEYKVASLSDRIIGRLIDSIIVAGYIFLLIVFAASLQSGLLMTIFILPAMFYTFIFEKFNNGQTPGKNIMMTRVVSIDGENVTTGMYFIRWLLLLVDVRLASGVIGIISILISEKGQRLGDIAASTTVISLKKSIPRDQLLYRRIPENYKPIYEEVQMMKDSEIETIKKILRSKSENRPYLITSATQKIEEVYGITKNASSQSFLNTIIKDYNYYQLQLHQKELGDYDTEDLV